MPNTTYEVLGEERESPSVVPRRNRYAYCLIISILVSSLIQLVILIAFYVTFLEAIETIKNSSLLKTISHVNLAPVNEAFREITSEDVKYFVSNLIYLMRQVTVGDITEFFKGAEQCLEGVCSG
jgi:type III secretory pathway component EscU